MSGNRVVDTESDGAGGASGLSGDETSKDQSKPLRLVLENIEVPETIRDSLTELFSKMFLKSNIDQDEYLKRQVLPTGSLRIEDVLQCPKVLEITDETAFINKVLVDCNGKSIWFAEDGVRAYVKPEQKTLILRNIPSTTDKEEINKIFLNLNNCPHPKDITSELNNTWYVVFQSEAEARSANACLKENQVKFNDEKISSNLKPEIMPKSVIPFSSPSNVGAQSFPAYSVPGFSPNGSPTGMPNTIFFPPGANYMAQNPGFVPGAVPLMNPVMYPMMIPRGIPGAWTGPGWQQGHMGQGPMQINMGNRVPNGNRVGGPNNTKNRNQPRNMQGRGGQNDNRGFNNRNYFNPNYRNNFRMPVDQFGNPIGDFVARPNDGDGAAVDAMFSRSGNDGDMTNDQMNGASRSQNDDDRNDDMANHDAMAQVHMMGGHMPDPQFHHNMEMFYMPGNMMVNPVMPMPIIDMNKGRKKNMRGKMDGSDKDQDSSYAGDVSNERGKNNRTGMNERRGKDKMDGRGGKGDIKRKNVPAADFNMESDFPTLGNEPVEAGATNSNNTSPSTKPVMTGWASAAAGNVANDTVSQAVSKPQSNNQNKNVGGNIGAKQTNNSKDKGTAPKPAGTPTNANAFTFGSFDSVPTNTIDIDPQTNNTAASNQDSENNTNSSIDASNNTSHTRDRDRSYHNRDDKSRSNNHSNDDSSDGAWGDSKKSFADMVRSK